jgi:excisionase family DNA binding protein
MVTVPEAAKRVGRNPETIRRWIRSGRLRSQKVGTQHLIDERDLDALVDGDWRTALPEGWRKTRWGAPMPNWARIIREDRQSH